MKWVLHTHIAMLIAIYCVGSGYCKYQNITVSRSLNRKMCTNDVFHFWLKIYRNKHIKNKQMNWKGKKIQKQLRNFGRIRESVILHDYVINHLIDRQNGSYWFTARRSAHTHFSYTFELCMLSGIQFSMIHWHRIYRMAREKKILYHRTHLLRLESII